MKVLPPLPLRSNKCFCSKSEIMSRNFLFCYTWLRFTWSTINLKKYFVSGNTTGTYIDRIASGDPHSKSFSLFIFRKNNGLLGHGDDMTPFRPFFSKQHVKRKNENVPTDSEQNFTHVSIMVVCRHRRKLNRGIIFCQIWKSITAPFQVLGKLYSS